MEKASGNAKSRSFVLRNWSSLIILLVNVVLLTFAALAYMRYTKVYQVRLREENLRSIANLNQSSALNATALTDSRNAKLKDVIRYLADQAMTEEEALGFMEKLNSSDSLQFELIGADHNGHLARRGADGGFIPLSYEAWAFADLQAAFDDTQDDAFQDVCFTPEFTDGVAAVKYFAVYGHVPLKNPAGAEESYTLLLASRSDELLSVLNSQDGFEGQSTILFDESGNYIVRSNDFKATNFFEYLYVYNDLSLDERNAVMREVAEKGSGELYYKNARGEDCVFRYMRMTTNDWYCVTSVPIASFRTPSFSASYVIYAVCALLILLTVDVLWLQNMNRRLRASAQREKEASEAKTEFLSRMSHDIRTPLNGIIGLTTLALEEESPVRLREYLSNIRVSGQFLSGLVNDILDLSKVESGKVELNPEPYSGAELYKYIMAVVAPLCRDKGLDFRVSEPHAAPPILLDRLRFNQIVFNLLSNAVKYTPPDGFVEFTWIRADLEDGRVRLELKVRDNGIGMSEEFQKHMFESFSQERSQTAKTGSGLGLAIVNSLVRLMNGSISVQSKPGEGSCFTVRLETRVCGEETFETPALKQIELEGKRALLCEDNMINTMVAQRMLEKWGMQVDTAENGVLGVSKFARSAPGDYDIVLMDVMMPEMDGLDATRAIRAMDRADAALPILAMTANAYDSDMKNCLEAGMNAHLGKPIDQERLHTLLCALLAGKNLGE